MWLGTAECIQSSGCLVGRVLLLKMPETLGLGGVYLGYCLYSGVVLTAEGAVPPANGDSRTLTGLSVRFDVVAER